MGRYQIYSTEEYFAHLTAQVSESREGDYIAIATMSFDYRADTTKQLIKELEGAARRGATVRLIVDAMPFLLDLAGRTRFGPLFYNRSLGSEAPKAEPFRSNYNALERVEQAGGRIAITNIPSKRFSVPVAGRSHIKFSVVNDYVYVGGCNLDQVSEGVVDVMVGWTDRAVAEWLKAVAVRLINNPTVRSAIGESDLEREISGDTTLLLDAGVRGRSKILDTALRVIDESTDYCFITCQFFPNSITARHLLAAYRRGVKVAVIYSDTRQHAWPGRFLIEASELRERFRLPRELFAYGLNREMASLHAKVLVSESDVLVGSHNFVNSGVQLGTAEMTLQIKDRALGLTVIENINEQIGVNAPVFAKALHDGFLRNIGMSSR